MNCCVIQPLHKAILSETTLKIIYQSFKAKAASEIVLYPYLLKEYRNRWFVIGTNKKNKTLMTLALDRIQEAHEMSAIPMQPAPEGIENFYNDVIGVTKSQSQKASTVVLKVANHHIQYLLTKPLHTSQKVLKKEEDGTIISIQVVLNYELEKEILGLGECIKVLAPRILSKHIKKRISEMIKLYED